jgi:hypothetical protein
MTRDQVLSDGPLPFSNTTVGRPEVVGPEQTMWRVRPPTSTSATDAPGVIDGDGVTAPAPHPASKVADATPPRSRDDHRAM